MAEPPVRFPSARPQAPEKPSGTQELGPRPSPKCSGCHRHAYCLCAGEPARSARFPTITKRHGLYLVYARCFSSKHLRQKIINYASSSKHSVVSSPLSIFCAKRDKTKGLCSCHPCRVLLLFIVLCFSSLFGLSVTYEIFQKKESRVAQMRLNAINHLKVQNCSFCLNKPFYPHTLAMNREVSCKAFFQISCLVNKSQFFIPVK